MSQEDKLKDYTTVEEVDYVKYNYGKLTNRIISTELGWSVSKLTRIAKVLGLKSNMKHRKYNANMELITSFKSPHIIYSLGYIWADGHVKTIKRSGKINYMAATLNILTEDYENIKNCLDQFGKSTEKFVHRKPYKPTAIWLLCDTILANYLKNMDYTDRSEKEPLKILNTIPENLRHYWWRGFFDGDGHLGIAKGGSLSIKIASNYNQPWEFCKEFLPFVNFKIIKTISPSGRSSMAFLSSSDALKFLNYIYQNREIDNIGLDRKYNKFLQCKDYTKKTEKDFNYLYYRKDTDRWVVAFKKYKISKTFTSKEDATVFRDSVMSLLNQ
jgi:hypothetical protein